MFSKSGSADMLEKLGISILSSKHDIENYLNTTNTYYLHEKLGSLVGGGYTGTNVSDFYLLSFEK